MDTHYAEIIIDKLESARSNIGGARIHALGQTRAGVLFFVKLVTEYPDNADYQKRLNSAVKDAEKFLRDIAYARR